MLTSEILDKAADVIERNGWHRGSFTPPTAKWGDRHCPVCVLGAINLACGAEAAAYIDGDSEAAAYALGEHLGLAVEEYGLIDAVGDRWNDSRLSAEEVVRELRAAAAIERDAGR